MPDSILKQSGVYKIVNSANGRCYVGSSINIGARWKVHQCKLRKNKHPNAKLQNAWHKHGEDTFLFSILEVVDSASQIVDREQYWIDSLDAAKTGYNIRVIAESNRGTRRGPMTSEQKSKLSMAKTGIKTGPRTKPKSMETRAKIAASKKGRPREPFSEEHRANMSAAAKGKKKGPLSAETRAKMSAVRKGRRMSDDHRAKISAALKGVPLTPERIENISRAKMAAKEARNGTPI